MMEFLNRFIRQCAEDIADQLRRLPRWLMWLLILFIDIATIAAAALVAWKMQETYHLWPVSIGVFGGIALLVVRGSSQIRRR